MPINIHSKLPGFSVFALLRYSNSDSNMKLIVILSVACLASCDYQQAAPEAPTSTYGSPTSHSAEATPTSSSSTPVQLNRGQYNFQTFYQGAFPPASLPAVNFLSQAFYPQQYPLRLSQKPLFSAPSEVSYSSTRQGILPPISQIVPPISQIVPPVLGGSSQPSFPINPILPPQVLPPQLFPPQVLSPIQAPKYGTYNYALPYYYTPLTQYSFGKTPYAFSFPSATLVQSPVSQSKEPAKNTETLSASYGPPTSEAVESQVPVESEGPVESSAPFDSAAAPAPASYPYEPAVPDSPEPAPFKPAQEYGLPSRR